MICLQGFHQQEGTLIISNLTKSRGLFFLYICLENLNPLHLPLPLPSQIKIINRQLLPTLNCFEGVVIIHL